MTDPDQGDTRRGSRLAFPPWRCHLPPSVSGTLVHLRRLPAVSLPLTVFLALAVLVSAAIPIAGTVVSGLLVGAIPAAVRSELASPAGQRVITILIIAALLIVVVRVLGPFRSTLAAVFARAVDRHLQERVMAAVASPIGVGHLEDPAILDLVKNAEGVGAEGLHPVDAVRSRATLLPSWDKAMQPVWRARCPGRPIIWLSTGVVGVFNLGRRPG
ncbi:MAG: hypothetical protein ACR2JY_16415 [Chloroflexota bacterium]